MSKTGKEKRLDEIYKEIRSLNPDHLADLNKMIRLYSQARIIIGHLDSEALYDYGIAYSLRKKTQAEIKLNTNGTGVEKESTAEVETHELRLKEAEAQAESRKWKNLFDSFGDLIIALRRDERTALEEYKNINDLIER